MTRAVISVSSTQETADKIELFKAEYGVNQSRAANMLLDFAFSSIDKIKEKDPDFVLGKPGKLTIFEEVLNDQNYVRNDRPNPFLIEKAINDILEGDYTDNEKR